jgi:hypothetical protein
MASEPADARFADGIADRLAAIPGVVAVALGGSRADGRHRPDSDWDFGVYYRGGLDPAHVRALGWEGEVFAPGEWGGGVMNGGAWLRVDGRRVDLIYRDLDEVEHWLAEARAGRYEVQRLPFYLAGIPTYVVAGELAVNAVLRGELPRPEYPEPLRARAAAAWLSAARLSADHAGSHYAALGDPLGCAGELARAVTELAHSRMAAAGRWVLNEKRLVDDADLGHLRAPFAALGTEPAVLLRAADAVRAEFG